MVMGDCLGKDARDIGRASVCLRTQQKPDRKLARQLAWHGRRPQPSVGHRTRSLSAMSFARQKALTCPSSASAKEPVLVRFPTSASYAGWCGKRSTPSTVSSTLTSLRDLVHGQVIHPSTACTGRRSDRGISGPRPNRTTRSGLWPAIPRKLANCGRKAETSTG